MHTREISVGGKTLSIETGRWPSRPTAPSSSARATRWSSSPPARDANPREGIDFLPLTVDYKEIHLRVGPHPRRLLQARRQAARKGSAHQPPDRSADPPAVPGRLALRDADHRARALGRHRERLRRARDHRRLGGAGALGAFRSDTTIAGVRVGLVDGEFVDQPDLRAAQAAARSTSSSPAARTAS